MKIGFDFDRVLFNTDKFKEHLEASFSGFSKTYSKARDNEGYDFRRHAEIMDVNPGKLLEELEDAKKYSYNDLDLLDELDHKKIIVSRGDEEFQKKKIQLSGVMKYFDEFYIVQDKPKDIVDIDILVDDSKKELDRVNSDGILLNRDKKGIRDIIQGINGK